MSDRLTIGPRLTFALCCMALVWVMLVQGAVSGLDQVQHGLRIDHAPNAFAGALRLDHADAADHRHALGQDHEAEDGHDDDRDQGTGRSDRSGHPGHTHFADGGQTLLASADFFDFKPAVHVSAIGWSAYDGRPLRVDARLDRPPKPSASSVA